MASRGDGTDRAPVASDRVPRAFGATLRALRTARRLSQEELAHRARTSQPYLSLLEKGRRSPSLTTLCLLARGLRMTVVELVAAFERQQGST